MYLHHLDCPMEQEETQIVIHPLSIVLENLNLFFSRFDNIKCINGISYDITTLKNQFGPKKYS